MIAPATMWNIYKNYIQSATRNSYYLSKHDITFWHNKLFTDLILYLIPVSLVALILGIYATLKSGQPLLAIFDLVTAVFIFGVFLNKKLSLKYRKFIIIVMLYILAIVLIVKLGLLAQV